ncbi:hypothetical protein JCM33374_g2599 [Metschnikowia sp. JCM 33374]|nr:hypothetical protein JCM33374_g2599 [Metschnikowia sp. JCM 33374]
MSFASLVYAYLLGGVTFIPLLVFAFVYLHPKKKPQVPEQPLKAGEIEEYAQTGLDCFKQGWIFVTHEDLESQDEISAKTESVSESQDVKSAYSSLYKLVTNTTKASGSGSSSIEASVSSNSDLPTSSSPSQISSGTVGPSAGASSGSGMVSPPPKPTAATKKHRYYAVLKHGNLFLYKNEKLQDVKHVIVLSNHVISLWPRTLSEGSLFTKYSSIAILKNDWSRTRRLSDNFSTTGWQNDTKISIHDVLRPDSGLPAPPGSIFVYTDLNIDKEDWYFALIRATKTDTPGPPGLNPSIYAKTMHLETLSMISLIQNLYGSEGQLQSKWFNAIIGRIFLSLQKTDLMKNYLISKIERKLNKMKTPGFLDKFQITKVDAGNAAPTLTFPVLKEINPEGDLLVSFNMQYTGGMSIQLATKVNINLGSRFKTREVDVLLSITLEKICGPMLVRIKAPPSARMWYTYEREPDVSIKIEPVISSRQMSYNIITNTIEKKFKDAIRDSLVLPHWDDLSFCRTPEALYRGGIWEKDPRAEETDQAPPNQESNQESNKDTNREPQDTASDSLSVDTGSDVTVDSEEQKQDTVSLIDSTPVLSQKQKVTKTISDISRRLRKPKSAHTLGVDETNCLSDGSVMEPPKRRSSSLVSGEVVSPMSPKTESFHNISTLRKLGEWYSKSDKTTASKTSAATSSAAAGSTYHPPEMITNRRTRKQSTATINSDNEKATDGSSYDFGKELIQDIRPPPRTIDVAAPPNVTSSPTLGPSPNLIPSPVPPITTTATAPPNISPFPNVTSSGNAKPIPPKLPPREINPADLNLQEEEPKAELDAEPFGGSLEHHLVPPHNLDYEHSGEIDNSGHGDHLVGHPPISSPTIQITGTRTNMAVGRKPPPESGDENDSVHAISTAPL